MKVLTTLTTINPLKGGGVCAMVYHLNKNLLCEKEVCSLDYNTSEKVKNEWNIFKTKIFKVIDPFSLYYGYSPDLKNYVLNNNADILHNHGVWEYTSWISLLWKKKSNKPYVITPHGMLDPWAIKNGGFKKRILFNLIEKRYLSQASCLHALNEEEAKAIKDLGLKNPISIIPNGIDIPSYSEKVEPIWDSKGKKTLLFLGRLHQKKGLENLLEAWKLLKDKNINEEWIIVIAGWAQNNYDKVLKDLSNKYKIDSSVIFLGSVLDEDKISVLQNSDAFILPSYSEGLPISILEAWAYKLPVLMTKECNLSSSFDVGAAIEITTDPTDIAESLESFFKLSQSKKDEMILNGFNLVKDNYSWNSVAEKMNLMYKWVLTSKNKPQFIN